MERLWLDGTGISDLSPIAGMTELTYLGLDNNKVTDLTVLIEMGKKDLADPTKTRFAPFWKIYLKGNPLSDAAKTTQLEELKKVSQKIVL
jgi:Leucine-rich repeat (LRR) protein